VPHRADREVSSKGSWQASLLAATASAGALAYLRRGSHRFRPLATTVLSYTAVAVHLRRALQRWRADASNDFLEQVHVAVMAGLRTCAQELDVDLSAVGVHAFVGNRRISRPWRTYLARVGEARLGSVPRSGITWTMGKGIIGQCWKTGNILVCDLSEFYSPFQSVSAWAKATDEVRLGLTYDEMAILQDTFSGVVAVPFYTHSDTPAGVVVFDTVHPLEFWKVADDTEALGAVIDILVEVGGVVGDAVAQLPTGIFIR
jgi:hypothetical protein